MEQVPRPPVNEVVLSVSFEPQDNLLGPQLLVTIHELLDIFPSVQEKPPYEMQMELPRDEQPLKATGGSSETIKILGTMINADRRYWLSNPENPSRLVQVQSGYFALNWRRQPSGSTYPGFNSLQEEFTNIFDQFQQATFHQGGDALAIRQVEVSYINILEPAPSLWQNHQQLNRVVQLDFPAAAGDVESIRISYSKAIHEGDDFVGRLHSSVSTEYWLGDTQVDIPLTELAIPDLIPIIKISTTVRSARLKGREKSEPLRFFRIAHDSATDAFRDLTTEVARNEWGLV